MMDEVQKPSVSDNYDDINYDFQGISFLEYRTMDEVQNPSDA
jgi:hypothetical protein